jgi:hypothetical protein
MQERVQAHRLGAGPRLGVEDGEIDAPPGKAFDLVDVEAFVDPVGEERLGRRAMRAHLPDLALRDRFGIEGPGADGERRLGEGQGHGGRPDADRGRHARAPRSP